jgi:hypothetical protein
VRRLGDDAGVARELLVQALELGVARQRRLAAQA